MSIECDDVSRQWEVRCVKVNVGFDVVSISKDDANERDSTRRGVRPAFFEQGLQD